MRDPHYGGMCFKSVETPGALHSYLWKRPFSIAKNVQLLGLYPMNNVRKN